jgi:DNA mismatch repair protein MutL
MPIQLLPPEVASKIAAGEVIERPASVVKELIENSLDAGAGEMRIEIAEGGRRLIRVIDDGHGIPAAEVELAFARHATSKLRTADDLDHIRTLGFRGEALASIAAVAQVTLLTRHVDEATATQVRLEDGHIVNRESHGAPPGTTIAIEHLFYNLPARLKFLRPPASEAASIQDMIMRYALAFPERRFSVVNGGRLAFQSTGSGDLQEVLSKVYGLETARSMIAVAAQRYHDVLVRGYISQPSLHRANRSYLTIFLNGRWIHDNSLNHAIVQAYHTMLPQGRYPLAILFVEMAPEMVDVNVHPTKAEVRFRDARSVFHAIERTVRTILVEQASVPTAGDLGSDAAGWAERRAAILQAGQPEAGASQAPLHFPRGQPGDERLVAPGETGSSPAASLPMLRVVGQVSASYIITEGPEGIYLIDQHAAHERILYEQLAAQRVRGEVASQRLLEPLPIQLSPLAAALIYEAQDDLTALGFDLEPFGPDTFLLRTLPAILSRGDPRETLEDLAQSLAGERNRVAQAEEEALVRLICKRAAVKAGQPLALAEMQEMVRQLEACRSPRTCPHGRPTMIHISVNQLAQEFGRR